MYYQFFGLQEDPFGLIADPKFLFLTWNQRRSLAGLTYALMSRKRCVMLTGGIGMGKTTLLAAALRCLPVDSLQFSLITNPALTPEEILETVLLGFGLYEIPTGKPQRVSLLQRFIQQGKEKGRRSAIVVDEAQGLTLDALEEIRLLGNLESLQIVLVGQSELANLLCHERAQALKQRIALRLTTEPLTAEEVGQYIQHRWTQAGGGPPAAFDPEAIEALVRYAVGTPRLINTICDNALMLAYGEQVPRASVQHVLDAVRILELPEPRQDSGPVDEMEGLAAESSAREKELSLT